MEIKTHLLGGGIQFAEVISTSILITTVQDGLDVLVNLYYQGFDKVILHHHTITPNFFHLKTGIAGEILQKFSNYRVHLIIVGDFSRYQSKSLRDFIFESNKGRQVNFVKTISEAAERFADTKN